MNKKLKKISFILSCRINEIQDNKLFYKYLLTEYLKYDNSDLNYEYKLYKKGIIQMKIEEIINNKSDTIRINEQEIKILNKMREISKNIFDLQELVIDYEQWGYDANEIEEFITNYPLKMSLFDYNPSNKWGEK